MKGLYIHIPFCKQKCKYCDFVSFQRMEDTADKYIDALKREAEQYKGEKIDTIFIGGGTPSILTPKQIEEVTKMCFDVFGADKIAQFNIQVGEELNVYFDVDAREWNGRWFNSIRAWKVDRVSAQAPVAPDAPFPPMNAAPAAPVDFASTDEKDDLPF